MSTIGKMGCMPLSGIAEVAKASAFGDSQALFSAVDNYVRRILNQTLCTVNRYEPQSERLTRLYSSNPLSYPVGASKNKSGTTWGRHVLHERQLFVGQGINAIRQSFDDHATIHALGLRSVINVPVVAFNTCLGTLNLLMQTETVDDDMIQLAQLASLLAAPGFLAITSDR